MSKRYWISLTALVLAWLSRRGAKRFSHEPILHEYHLETSHWREEKEARLLFLSDYAGGNAAITADDLYRLTKAAAPDVVVLGGNFFHAKGGNEEAFRYIHLLKDKLPVWLIAGDHEATAPEAFYARLHEEGVTPLLNQGESLTKGTGRIEALGLEPETLYGGSLLWENALAKALKKETNEQGAHPLRIVFAHRPNRRDILDLIKADVAICGGTGGGLWRLPLFGGVFSKRQGFMPRYDAGRYAIRAGAHTYQLIVSRGLEVFNLIPRYRNRPEALVLIVRQSPLEKV